MFIFKTAKWTFVSGGTIEKKAYYIIGTIDRLVLVSYVVSNQNLTFLIFIYDT